MTPPSMIQRWTAIVLILGAAALPARAQSPEAEAAAQAYVGSVAMQTMITEMLSPDAMMTTVRASLPVEVEAETIELMADVVSGELSAVRPELERAMVDAAAATFTVAEIEALTEFYSTEIGTSILGKMQPFMASTMEDFGPALQAAQARIAERLEALVAE